MTAALVLAATLLQAAGARSPEPPAAAAGTAARPAVSRDAAAIAARALELQKQGRLAAAAAEYERFLQLVPQSWEVLSNLGVIRAQLGELRKGRGPVPAGAAPRRPAPAAGGAIHYNLAVALYKAGRMRDAAGELESVLKAQPGHPAAPLLLADCRLQLGEWRQVIALLDPLLERDPENQAILYMLGTALMRDRQYERGQRVLDRILRRGDSAEAHLVLAIASREAKDDLAAEKELRRALELNPGLPTANALLGEVLVKRATRPEPSRRCAASSRSTRTTSTRTCCSPCCCARTRRTAKRSQHVTKALALRPGDPGARLQAALVHVAEGRLEAARQLLEPLVAEEPSFSEAHVSLATVYYRLGRREDGNREQQVVQRLKAEQRAREDAEKARQQAASPQP